MGSLIAAGVLVVVVLILLFKYIKMVEQGFNLTVERFGKYVRTLQPGLHFLTPVFESVGAKVNMKEQVMLMPAQEVITKDNAMVRVDGVVFFQVLDAPKAAYEVNDMFVAILNLTTTNLRTVVGSMDLDELLSKRDEINGRLLIVVDEATSTWGIKITRIEVKDISPPTDIVDAMARQMKAERDKRATILEAEGQRASEILEAEGTKQAAILEAEGRKEAAFRDAEARERLAEAEGRATKVVSDAIAKGDQRAINYFVAQKYVEAIGKFATSNNEKLVFMPMETSGLIGSIGGIAELIKDMTTGKSKKGKA